MKTFVLLPALLLCTVQGLFPQTITWQQTSENVIFDDQFDGPILGPNWVISPGRGNYSLTNNPGYLRYIIDADHTGRDGTGGYAKSLWLVRPFSGDTWILKTAITYNMRPGVPTNNRNMNFVIRAQDDAGITGIYRSVGVNDGNPGSNAMYISAGQSTETIYFSNSPNPLPFERWYLEIERNKHFIAIRASNDGNDSTFEYKREYTFPPGSLGNDQKVEIEGNGWYGSNDPPGYAEIDFIKVVPEVPPLTGFIPQIRVGTLEYNPDIAFDNTGNIYIAGEGWRDIYPEIFLSKSIDGGSNFTRGTPVTMQTAGFIEKPAVAIDANGNIHIVYLSSDYYISYAKSTNGGVSFTTPVKISDLPASPLTRPKIAVYGNNIYVVWHYDDTDYKIYLDKSIGGGSFGTDVQVNDITSGTRGYPSITGGTDGNIYVTWIDGGKVYFAKSTNQGTSFGTSVRIDDSDSTTKYPSLATFGSTMVYVAWEDYRNVDADVRLAKSINGGISFGASVKVNDDTTANDQKFPRIVVDSSGTIYTIWQDGRNDNSTPDIYYAHSTNGGASFSTNLKINSATGKATYGHKYPAFTVTDKVCVAWMGSTATLSGWQIYFSKAIFPPAGPTSVVEESKTIPLGFVLYQNYPNPFNPTTVISYQLSVAGSVELRIFDLLGREVVMLVNEEKSVGAYSITWDAKNLPSGVYFYRLQSGTFTETKKLLLLR